MKPLSNQELHNLAMNLVGRELESAGYEFMAVNSKLGKNPQFVCLKDGSLHFVVVRPVPYLQDPQEYDAGLMERVKEHALKFEARTFFAGVGLSHADDPLAPVLLNEPYRVAYEGLIEV